MATAIESPNALEATLSETHGTLQLVSFGLADEVYGIEITKVREIILISEITQIPQTPHYVKGLINLRSTVIPVIDLRALFGLPEGEKTDESRIMVLQAGGKRDYVIKIDFTGPRHIVIPNGEVAWSAGYWGWRFSTKHFDSQATLGKVGLGFGFIPPKTSPHVVVTDIRLLDNLPGVLRDPVIHLGSGKLQMQGEVLASEYLTYTATEGAKVFDRNWKFLRTLESKPDGWIVPHGVVDVRLENAAPDPQPWLELQLITRGEPFPLAAAPKK